MSSFTLIDVFFYLSLLLFMLSFVYTKLTTKCKTYGPRAYPFIGCLVSFNRNKTRLLDWYTELLAASPTQTIVVNRVGVPKTFVTANPKNVEYILKTNFPNFPKGKAFSDILGDLLGHGIFNVDGELWAAQRKLASHEFTTNSLRDFVVKILEEEVEDRLIPLLQSAAKENKIIDLQEVLKRFTYDTICKVSLGTDPNCLSLSAPIPPLIEAIETAAGISALRSVTPIQLIWKLKRAFNLGSEVQLKQSVETIHTLVSNSILQKQKTLFSSEHGPDGPAPNNDFLSRFLSAGHDSVLARDMVISFLMAGRETTSAAMTWLFWLISGNYSNVRESIRAELSATSGQRQGSGQLRYELVRRDLKYLHACLCESMRLYPPVPWDSKHAAKDDILPDGTRVKKGERVTYFPYGMGRMETLWGNDWSKYDPDRWFETNEINQDQGAQTRGSLKMVSPYVFPVFQGGPRVCLGKEMAFIQMKFVVASIVNRFDFELVSLKPPVFVPLMTAQMAGGLKVRVKEIGSK